MRCWIGISVCGREEVPTQDVRAERARPRRSLSLLQPSTEREAWLRTGRDQWRSWHEAFVWWVEGWRDNSSSGPTANAGGARRAGSAGCCKLHGAGLEGVVRPRNGSPEPPLERTEEPVTGDSGTAVECIKLEMQ